MIVYRVGNYGRACHPVTLWRIFEPLWLEEIAVRIEPLRRTAVTATLMAEGFCSKLGPGGWYCIGPVEPNQPPGLAP